ncbi:inner membrane protein [Melghirimyces profundicolus]|uniref:Inner membrane protein n=1 Tax=Melghirimyces profundicolus TaxID=1242148 RepID=A0A2T6C7T5_9BACL|nr:metal-dependent hydrolase [Melghirimyces profundicolus]PTX64375.1 inner membrane protein [Melghirimyces profundicolus]
MDTASHVLMGVTLAGLAHTDPAVAGDPALSKAVIAGCVFGSNAPDLDGMTRFKGYASYLRHHRGVTHSVFAWLLWPVLIGSLLIPLFQVDEHVFFLWIWILVGVLFHVFLDVLNTYGTQWAWPFSKKWFHLDILSIFEPFLFFLHFAGLLLWWSGISAASVFPGVYAATFVYIAVRALQHRHLVRRVREYFGERGSCQVTPTLHWFHWVFVMETSKCFHTGKVVYGNIILQDTYPKASDSPIIRASMETDGVRAFLSFAQRIHVSWKEKKDGYLVSWSDVRFWYDRKLSFGVDIQLDRNLSVREQKLGWRKKAWDPPYV